MKTPSNSSPEDLRILYPDAVDVDMTMGFDEPMLWRIAMSVRAKGKADRTSPAERA